MKSAFFATLTFLWTTTLLVPFNSFAQDSTQWHLPEGAKARLGNGSLTGRIAFSSDGTQLAVASAIGIWLYDVHNGQALHLIPGDMDWVNSLALSPDGETIAGAGEYGKLQLWNTATGRRRKTLKGHTRTITSVAFSPDGKMIASASEA